MKSSVPVVMTVHDTIPWTHPKYRRSLRKRAKLSRQKRGVESAQQVITVSETSLLKVTALTQVPKERIHVTYEDVDPLYMSPASKTAVTAAQKQHDLQRPYFFYVGGYDPRKRVPMLVDAFGRSGLARDYDLVLAGSATQDPLYEDYRRLDGLIQSYGLTGAVKRVGFLPENTKHALLSGASGFPHPSSDEGFGLPVLEALRCGIPAVVADIPVMRELFGEAAEVFSPDTPAALGARLRSLVGQEAAPSSTLDRFSWEMTARKTAEVLRTATR